MQDDHTVLYDPTTDEFIFLTNNAPDYTALELWRVGALRIYRPGDFPDILVSIDPTAHRRTWPFSRAPIATATLPPHPWIPYSEVTYGLPDHELIGFDRWCRHSISSGITLPHPPHWNDYERPVLARVAPPPFVRPVLAPTPSPTPFPQPSAPLSPSIAPAPLPPHIQRLAIDAAVAARAVCPITLDPITAAIAVVTPCGHVFGCRLDGVARCPVCRAGL